ncbi:MAG: AraC family transcriptional regulator [Victivallaceae bacterium]|nr:AraC family transcriptional regulator [Victivallaceae bacterium]
MTVTAEKLSHWVSPTLVYRSIGWDESREGIGAGFICKRGVSRDNVNLVFPRYVLVIVVNGRGTYIDAGGIEYPLSEGMFFQRLPGVAHSNFIDPESDWQEYYIETGKRLYDALRTMRIIDSDKLTGRIRIDAALTNKIDRLITQLKTAGETELPELLNDGIALLIDCSRRMRKEPVDDNDAVMLAQACELLAADFQSPVNLADFCRRHGWGYERFRKVFRDRIGISPGKYRLRRRLDASCELLSAPGLSIAEIAAVLGYSSQYEFSAQFKRYIGIAPKFFRSGTREAVRR